MYILVILVFVCAFIFATRKHLEREFNIAAKIIEQVEFYNRMRRKLLEQTREQTRDHTRRHSQIGQRRGTHAWAVALYEDQSLSFESAQIFERANKLDSLPKQLATIEAGVALLRRQYNMTMTQYNEALTHFPCNMIGPMLGYECIPILATISDQPVDKTEDLRLHLSA
jgi:hypothetical protein